MKDLYKHIKEGILSDIDTSVGTMDDDIDIVVATANIKKKLNEYLVNTLHDRDIKIYKDGKDFVVDLNADVYYTHSQQLDGLTDGSFRFGRIYGNFIINETRVKSLKYGPHTVDCDFEMYYTSNMHNLKYCPKYVGGDCVLLGTDVISLEYLPEEIDGVLNLDSNHIISNKGIASKNNKCFIGGYVHTRNNNKDRDFHLKDFSKCSIKFKRGCIFEGILGDINDTLTKSDAAAKELERQKKLSKLNIPTINDYRFSGRTNTKLYYIWDIPTSIYNDIKPFIKDCVSKAAPKNVQQWYKDWVATNAKRIKVSTTGKLLEIELIREESADGVTLLQVRSKEFDAFGTTYKDMHNTCIRVIEQLALNPEILKEIMKNPSTKTKDCKSLYDKLMSAE